MKIMIFTEGTLIVHKGSVGLKREQIVKQVKKQYSVVHDYASYVPIGNAVKKLSSWKKQESEILYLSSRRSKTEVSAVQHVLKKFKFPDGKLVSRRIEESYGDVIERIVPDILIEDDCESIGGIADMTITSVKPELKKKIKSIVVKEFGGIDNLPDNVSELLEYDQPTDKKIKEVYNKIAESFYNFRQQPITPELEKMAEKWKPGLLLDIGCGIGNSTLPFAKKGFKCFATDIAQKNIKFAKKYFEKHDESTNFSVSEMLNLPFSSEKFDYVICIAALHHLDSEEKRLKSLIEIKRVLKKKGEALITVWKGEEGDRYVSWTRNGKKYQRYYHFFKEGEIKNLFEKTRFRNIEVFEDEKEKNICVLAFK